MYTLNIKHLIVLLFISLSVASCQKDDDENEDNNPTIETKDLSLHFMNKWDGEAFAYNTVYSIDGVDIKFQEIRYYLSNFEISDAEGNSEALSTVLLIDAGLTEHLNLSVLADDWTDVASMDFLLGLDEVTNHLDPTVQDAPLNDGTMHWGWAPESGYKFIKIEGERDLNGDGTFEPFSIHAATDNLKRSISKDINMDVENNGLMIMTHVDYSAFFEGVDMSADPLDGTHGDSALTNAIADQVGTAISMM